MANKKKDIKETVEKKEIEKVEIPEKKKYSKEEIEAATKSAKKEMVKEIMPYIIIIIFVILIRSFIMTPVDVSGESMYPTLHDNDIMLLYKLRLKTVGINRFDIVVINSDDGKLIKRVIGLPGDKIRYKIELIDDMKKGTLYINGEEVDEPFISEVAQGNTCRFNNVDICEGEVEVPEGEYYVMGDNRGVSKDSRMLGTIPKKDIKGITSFVIFPFNRFGSVK